MNNNNSKTSNNSSNLSSSQKADLLKDTIEFFYSKEGRSKSYISRVLNIDRKVLANKIKEWSIQEAPHKKHLTPSIKKFINKNRQLIKSRLDNNVPISDITKELKCNRSKLYEIAFIYDDVLKKAFEDYQRRNRDFKNDLKKKATKEKLSSTNPVVPLENEIWKEILGYPTYFVSDKGRFKREYKDDINSSISYSSLLNSFRNDNNNQLYISLKDSNNKKHNLNAARLVAFAFVDGHSKDKNIISFKDKDETNIDASNLYWKESDINSKQSIQPNNSKFEKKRAIKENQRIKQIILTKDEKIYRFKTLSALARFMSKSESQVRRYLKEPEKYDLQIIYNRTKNKKIIKKWKGNKKTNANLYFMYAKQQHY